MARQGFFGRIRKALRYILTGTDTSTPEAPKLVPVPEANEEPLPTSGAIPGLSYENNDTASERADRRKLVRQVMDWFNREDASWDISAGRYVNQYGEMRSPARPSTVVRNISDFTNLEVEFGLMMDREEWQDMASRISGYWYH